MRGLVSMRGLLHMVNPGSVFSGRSILLLILITLAASSTATAVVELGSGRQSDVVNLETGAKTPGYRPFVSPTGFSAPQSPQPKVLDPGILVYQAERLRDESAAIRDDTAALLEQAVGWAGVAQTCADNATALAEQTSADADSAASDARFTSACLAKARDLYNETLNLSANMEELANSMTVLAEQTNNNTTCNALAARSCLDETRAIYNETLNLSRNIGSLATEVG